MMIFQPPEAEDPIWISIWLDAGKEQLMPIFSVSGETKMSVYYPTRSESSADAPARDL